MKTLVGHVPRGTFPRVGKVYPVFFQSLEKPLHSFSNLGKTPGVRPLKQPWSTHTIHKEPVT